MEKEKLYQSPETDLIELSMENYCFSTSPGSNDPDDLEHGDW